MLIEKRADINMRNNKGQTALMLAAHANKIEVCKLLIDALVKPTKKETDPIVKLLGIKRYKRSEQLNLQDKDVVKQLMGREAYNQLVQENKPKAEMEINRIEDVKKRQELLNYLKRI